MSAFPRPRFVDLFVKLSHYGADWLVSSLAGIALFLVPTCGNTGGYYCFLQSRSVRFGPESTVRTAEES